MSKSTLINQLPTYTNQQIAPPNILLNDPSRQYNNSSTVGPQVQQDQGQNADDIIKETLQQHQDEVMNNAQPQYYEQYRNVSDNQGPIKDCPGINHLELCLIATALFIAASMLPVDLMLSRYSNFTNIPSIGIILIKALLLFACMYVILRIMYV